MFAHTYMCVYMHSLVFTFVYLRVLFGINGHSCVFMCALLSWESLEYFSTD